MLPHGFTMILCADIISGLDVVADLVANADLDLVAVGGGSQFNSGGA